MSIKEVYLRYKESGQMFRCPLCHESMQFQNENSLVCGKRHCFDLSKYGYLNFLPNQAQTLYSTELFEYRREVFERGYYQPLQEFISRYFRQSFGKEKIIVLDAGCGEGFYARNLYENNPNAQIYAMDNAKSAVILGARKSQEIKWLVGDLANIPMESLSVDLILNIFTPSNYTEFIRILKKDGVILKIIPGEKYLIELRQLAREQLSKEEYSNEAVVEHLKKHMEVLQTEHIFYQRSVSQKDLNAFIGMSPMMFHVNKEKLDTGAVTELSFDFIILIGRKRRAVG